VRLEKDARRVTVHDGQALFDVAHDSARPFLITAGDETVRVVGTKFDVRRRDGQLTVTVLRGLVEVSTDGEDNARAPAPRPDAGTCRRRLRRLGPHRRGRG
jgi:transmembrane sensor